MRFYDVCIFRLVYDIMWRNGHSFIAIWFIFRLSRHSSINDFNDSHLSMSFRFCRLTEKNHLIIGTSGTPIKTIAVHSKSKCNKQPRFSWSLIYEKHRRFAPRSGRVAPKSDTSNTKKGALFLWAPQD